MVKALPRRGFFRAGRYWPPEWTEVEVDPKVAKVLEAEPMLSTKRVTGKAAGEGAQAEEGQAEGAPDGEQAEANPSKKGGKGKKEG